MSETTKFFLMQIALLAIVLVLHTYIGLHIIRRMLIFSDLVLDQLAAFGVLVGIGLGLGYGTAPSYLMSLAAVLLGCFMLAVIKPKNNLIPREAAIGIMYALALVVTLLLGDKLVGGEGHVSETLTGSMLWVTLPLVCVTAVSYILLVMFHYAFRYRFIDAARRDSRLGENTLWDFLFFCTQGIITVLIVPIAGVLLAYAFLMIPAAIAIMFTKRWGAAVALGWSCGFAACLIGLFSSYSFDLPYGPSLVLSLGLFFLCAVFIRALLRQKKGTIV